MKSKKFIILLVTLILLMVGCNSKPEEKAVEETKPQVKSESESKSESRKPRVEVEEIDPEKNSEMDDNLSKAFEILTSNEMVKAMEYEGAKYIESYDEDFKLNGKTWVRVDYIEDNSTHIHTAQRYAVDVESGDILVYDVARDAWISLEEKISQGVDERALGLLLDYKKIQLTNPILEVGTDFYISVVDLAKVFDLKLEYEENMHDPTYKDVTMTNSNGRFVYAAGNVVYSSDGIYYVNPDIHDVTIYKGDNIYLNTGDVAQAFHVHLRFNADENAVEFITNDEENVYPVYYNFYDENEENYEEKAPFDIVWKDGNYIMSDEGITLSEYISNLVENYDYEDPIYQTEEGLFGIFDFYMTYEGDKIEGWETP